MIYGGEGKYTKPLSWNFFHTRVVKRVKGLDFVYLPSLSYHSYLVCELFGMLSLHYFTFIFSCFGTFTSQAVTVRPKHK